MFAEAISKIEPDYEEKKNFPHQVFVLIAKHAVRGGEEGATFIKELRQKIFKPINAFVGAYLISFINEETRLVDKDRAENYAPKDVASYLFTHLSVSKNSDHSLRLAEGDLKKFRGVTHLSKDTPVQVGDVVIYEKTHKEIGKYYEVGVVETSPESQRPGSKFSVRGTYVAGTEPNDQVDKSQVLRRYRIAD